MKGDGLGKFLGFLFVFLLLVAGAVGGGYFYADSLYRQAGPMTADGSPRTVIIEPKSTVSSIATKLVEAGAIRNDLVFRGAVRLTNATMRLKAGEYAFNS
jgi:cell division protein YceG involved in septum cleavage